MVKVFGLLAMGTLACGAFLTEYGRAAIGIGSDKVSEAIPLGLMIKRIEVALSDANEEIVQTSRERAKLKVPIKQGREEVARSEAKLQKDYATMCAIRSHLPSGKGTTRLVSTTTAEVETLDAELARRLARYQAEEKNLVARKRMLSELENSYEKLSEVLEVRRDRKSELELKLQKITLDVQTMKLQSGTRIPSDDNLKRIDALINDLDTRVETELAVLEENLAGYNDVFSAELVDLPEPAHGAVEFDMLFRSDSTEGNAPAVDASSIEVN